MIMPSLSASYRACWTSHPNKYKPPTIKPRCDVESIDSLTYMCLYLASRLLRSGYQSHRPLVFLTLPLLVIIKDLGVVCQYPTYKFTFELHVDAPSLPASGLRDQFYGPWL